MPSAATTSVASGWSRIVIACSCIGAGAFICAAALRWIDVRPAQGVPYWIAGLAGVVFLVAGIAVALPQHPSRIHDALGATLFTAFATIALWVGFGPGPRAFNGAASIGPVSVGGIGGGETLGRIVFGIMGVVVLFIAAIAWRRLFRPRDTGEPRK
jgi:hypothetical protein